MSRTLLVLAAAVLAACAPRASSTAAPAEPAAAAPPASAATAAAPARPKWQNPGGMWLPQQLAAQADTLRALGLELDPAGLGDPLAAPLGAVVSLGGCSAAFVSGDGLIITNHHCIQGALQYNATPEQNLIETGYLARTRADEKWAGPTSRVFVTLKYTDVTAGMTDGLAAVKDDRERKRTLAAREKQLLATCEKDRPGLRCRVADFFSGGQWMLIEQLELEDVRLVYAPAAGIGNFGGEIDNWRWPRHTGDFAFLRAYVGKDGKPATHAADNQPYRPAHFLRVAREPLQAGDLVMVAGFPGTTSRLATSVRLAEAAGWEMPRTVALNTQYLALIAQVTADKPALQIKAQPRKRRLDNYLTKTRGQLETIGKGSLVERRQREDAELRAWIGQDPARAEKYAQAVDELAALQTAQQRTREHDAALAELVLGTSSRGAQRAPATGLLAAAYTIVRQAEERQKPDGERALDYQERNWQLLEQELTAFEKIYARELDRAILRMFVERALALPVEQQPAVLARLLGKKRDAAAIDAALDKLYAGTRLEDTRARVALLKSATPATLARSKDTFVQLALAVRPEMRELEERRLGVDGAMARLAPVYVAALRERRGGAIAPDANSTLRLTFGTVQPAPQGGRSFTTLTELVAKITGEPPFHAPAALVSAAQAGKLGPYAAVELGDLPVDFMSDLDITNGNSGSSTLNARGELVGLAFDGTYEGVASDWLYLAGISRTIHCDIRYTLWVMDAVDGADALLEEMGVTPAL